MSAPEEQGERAEEAVEEQPAAAADEEQPALSVVFLDPGDADRSAVEDLEDEIGCSVWTFAPREFGLETLDEIAEAAAIVLEWDLGGQSGLDLVETLLWDERTREIPVLVASAAPTRAMVTAAIRAGARSFVRKPYEAEDLKQRLAPLLAARRAAGESGSA